MRDPLTVAFVIPCFWQFPKDGYRTPLITIWHRDPESDGSDNSCGWIYPNISPEEVETLEKLAKEEREMLKYWEDNGFYSDAFGCIYWVWSVIAWRLYRRETLSLREMQEIISLAYNPSDNLQRYCYPNEFEHLFRLVARCYKRINRPWWKHPRYHVHHWRLQIHPLQSLRRMFDRCDGCGKHFPYGYSPISTGSKLYHHECYGSRFDD